jgi:GrpB-like predicted nucleotidyltransferase (UPF0157 family)
VADTGLSRRAAGATATCDAYAELKRALAREHRHDREAYTAAKAEIVERVLSDIR